MVRTIALGKTRISAIKLSTLVKPGEVQQIVEIVVDLILVNYVAIIRCTRRG